MILSLFYDILQKTAELTNHDWMEIKSVMLGNIT